MDRKKRTMKIRNLLSSDAVQAASLYRQLYPNAEYESVDLSPASFSATYVPFCIEREGRVCAVATGMVIATGGITVAYIEELVVDAKFRNQGLGSALVARLLEVFKEHKARAVFVATDYQDENGSPIPFYRKLGFIPTRTPWLVRRLGE